jgi:hypothetical protein
LWGVVLFAAMITKILFTLGVVGLAWLFLRNRARRQQLVAEESRRLISGSRERGAKSLRYSAYGLILFMISASCLFIYLEWQKAYRVVRVRVINTQSGEEIIYQAERGNVGERTFETLDGRRINVAGVERIEVEELQSSSLP